MSKKPQIVIIPGAWHVPEHAATFSKKLEEAGYTVHARKLPSVGNPNPPKDFTEDIAAVQELVTKAIGDGNDVIVVPHSWGGIVAGAALVGFGKKDREAKGEKGGVVRLAYMCAFIVDEGVSLMDGVGGKPMSWWEVKPPHCFPLDPNIFYNDLPAEEQQHWFKLIESQSLGTFESKAPAAAWRDIPMSYLLAENDLAIPAAAQEAMAQRAIQLGADVEIERINSSHSPFLSQPDDVVKWINKIAGQ